MMVDIMIRGLMLVDLCAQCPIRQPGRLLPQEVNHAEPAIDVAPGDIIARPFPNIVTTPYGRGLQVLVTDEANDFLVVHYLQAHRRRALGLREKRDGREIDDDMVYGIEYLNKAYAEDTSHLTFVFNRRGHGHAGTSSPAARSPVSIGTVHIGHAVIKLRTSTMRTTGSSYCRGADHVCVISRCPRFIGAHRQSPGRHAKIANLSVSTIKIGDFEVMILKKASERRDQSGQSLRVLLRHLVDGHPEHPGASRASSLRNAAFPIRTTAWARMTIVNNDPANHDDISMKLDAGP